MQFASWCRSFISACVIAALVTGCTVFNAPLETTEQTSSVEYRVGSGDSLRIIVFGEEQLSGVFAVDGSGRISLPLVRDIPVKGLNTREIETAIALKLKDGYVQNPRINVEVVNFRPFYVLGEVNQPGRYNYTNGTLAVTAVAMAGGFTYRGRQDYVIVIRGADPAKTERRVPLTAAIYPDDIVRVVERFF